MSIGNLSARRCLIKYYLAITYGEALLTTRFASLLCVIYSFVYSAIRPKKDSVCYRWHTATHKSVSRNLSPVTHKSVSRNLSPVTHRHAVTHECVKEPVPGDTPAAYDGVKKAPSGQGAGVRCVVG